MEGQHHNKQASKARGKEEPHHRSRSFRRIKHPIVEEAQTNMEDLNAAPKCLPTHSSHLQRFNNFHGMLCSPRTAQRCITALTGNILFMPSNYKVKGIRHYLVTDLNIWTYYGLVFASLTGLSTLLGLTRTIKVEENLNIGINCPEFESDPDILQIVVSPTASSTTHSHAKAKVIRRYSYHFLLPMFRVQMFHVISDDAPEKMHLVEIFDAKNGLSSVYALTGFLLVSFFVSQRRHT